MFTLCLGGDAGECGIISPESKIVASISELLKAGYTYSGLLNCTSKQLESIAKKFQ